VELKRAADLVNEGLLAYEQAFSPHIASFSGFEHFSG
jgi:hypothetical protein